MIVSGDLGEIYFISTSRVNLGLHQPDVSVTWDLGPHDFSILRYWLEDSPSHVSALSRSCVIPGTPDVAFINMEFGSQTIAHVELSWLAPSKLRRTTVVGSEKMIVYDDVSTEPVRVFDSGVMLRDPQTLANTVSPTAPVTSSRSRSRSLSRSCSSSRTSVPRSGSGTLPRSSREVGLDVFG